MWNYILWKKKLHHDTVAGKKRTTSICRASKLLPLTIQDAGRCWSLHKEHRRHQDPPNLFSGNEHGAF